MSQIYRTIEILILVVLPILLFYLRSNWSQKAICLNATILPILWYIFYAPIHELGHILGAIIVGSEITNYRLFSHFWEGSFGYAFVEIKNGYGINLHSFIILIAPYFLDFISILIGYYILNKYKIKNPFFFGIVYTFLLVRPLYDLVANYIAFYYNHSDFVLASKIFGKFPLFTFTYLAIFWGLFSIFFIVKKHKNYPYRNT